MSKRHRSLLALLSLFGLLAPAAAALADDCFGFSDILPPDAIVHGYSLKDAAEATANYNLSQGTTPLDVPFQFVPLEGTTTVTEGTFLYLPIFFSDNSPPILGNFPNDVQNQFADAVYFFDPADGIGLEEVDVTVDNERTVSLGPEYVVGFNTRPLLDGATKDVQLATFLAPLSKGTHTIAVHVELDGAAALAAGIPPVFDTTATLIVK